jgi:hypothetical protein
MRLGCVLSSVCTALAMSITSEGRPGIGPVLFASGDESVQGGTQVVDCQTAQLGQGARAAAGISTMVDTGHGYPTTRSADRSRPSVPRSDLHVGRPYRRDPEYPATSRSSSFVPGQRQRDRWSHHCHSLAPRSPP